MRGPGVIEVVSLQGRSVAVLGLGRAGLATAKALKRGNADVWAWDDDAEARRVAAGEGVPLVDLHACEWSDVAALVQSPGIPHTHPSPHPVAALARQAGCEIIGDVELLARSQRDARYIGITGTNGKSTTTALIDHVLGAAGQRIEVGGNIGTPALAMEPLGSDGTYVLEMSSYQLELSPSVTFDVAVLLNISPDHLERHRGMSGYVAAKKMIFQGQTAAHTAIVCIDDAHCRSIFEDLDAASGQAVIPVSGHARAAGGVFVFDGVLHDDTEGRAAPVMDLRGLTTLPGAHNWQNSAAAYAAAKAAGAAPRLIAEGIGTYSGLAHRQELVSIVDAIAYVNDSKATNADASAKALACYDNVYWIVGGQAKHGGLQGLEPLMGRIRHAFLIGEAAPAFADSLRGKVDISLCGDLATAVWRARDTAVREGFEDAVVLLSPACASFDQFANFEARGDAFRALVEAMPAGRAGEADGGQPGGRPS
ncbi:MAG: UDP-N-acetylmuramoyl-L-alanine--D-glutamate ligase [Rhodospirillales bacterium]|jgi:UDP-N-acetylmuramoylalanine--D-glutamate ligase|nr:UDP-N-acetylmuramoyl-L-alanine--D-glutamate ligase [Rhodospirillales bacterium]